MGMGEELLPSKWAFGSTEGHCAKLDPSEKPGNRTSVQAQPLLCCVVLGTRLASLCSPSSSNVYGWGHCFTHECLFQGSGLR